MCLRGNLYAAHSQRLPHGVLSGRFALFLPQWSLASCAACCTNKLYQSEDLHLAYDSRIRCPVMPFAPGPLQTGLVDGTCAQTNSYCCQGPF